MTIDTITREALVEKLKQYPTLLQQFLVLVDTQGTTLDDIQEILKLAEEAESNAVKAQTNATIAQEEAEKASTSASKVDAFDERIINLENSTAKVKEENTFTQVNNFNSGIKTDKFKTSGGLDIINHDGTNINIGNSSKTLKLTGTQSRPTYKEQDLALLTDVNSSLTTAIRYTDTETTERKAQDTALQTNINSNWSLLMANLGIGRWANQTFVREWWGANNIFYDSMLPLYTNVTRTFASVKGFDFSSSKPVYVSHDFNASISEMRYTFAWCELKNELLLPAVSQAIRTHYCFYGSAFTKIGFKDGVEPWKLKGTISWTFANMPNLTEIGAFDVSQVNNYDGTFKECPKLKSIHITHFRTSFNISPSTAFEESDLVEIISNLDPVTSTQTLTMGATNLAKLTDDEKKVATDKGWVLA